MDMLQTPNIRTLPDLTIFTEYTVYVAASTVVGVGPADWIVLTTANFSKW